MKRVYVGFLICLALCLLPALPVRAAGGVQDPGFSYVDVNNDGLYNAADGDIGPVTTQVMDGTFDTGRSEPGYTAPCYPASLVISKLQTFNLGVSVNLNAGVNLIIFGNINDPTSPTVKLTACRNIYMAGISVAFQNQLNINGGLDVNIDGDLIAGGTASKAYICAGGDLSARTYLQTGTFITATNITAGALISTSSCGSTFFDGANIATSQSGSSIDLEAQGSLEAVDSANISSNGGPVDVESDCDLVRLQGDTISGGSLCVEAYDAAILDGSIITTTGAVTVNAGGPVDGITDTLPLIVNCSAFTVCSYDSVDLDSSNIFASSGAISVTGQGDVTANSVGWTANTQICITSNCGDIYARTAHMEVLSLLGPIRFYAGGRLIDVTGSVLIGTVTYGPHNVTVIGSPL